ncbi:MAG: aspartyl/asparaginyl beta-hydroxylase domain-containing protein [Acidimicrobiales bacterium]
MIAQAGQRSAGEVPDRLRLGLQFDPAPLAAEVEALPAGAWIPHFNKAVHEGEWSGVTLRGPDGDASRIYPDPTGTRPIRDTAMLSSCPATGQLLAGLRCPVVIARFLALGPGALIRPHQDEGLGFEAGTVRLHFPVVSAREVAFELAGSPVVMEPGECWYLDFRRTHAAANRSAQRRVHLVVDCTVDEWLTEVFREAVGVIPVTHSR